MPSSEDKKQKLLKKLAKIKAYTDWLHEVYSKVVFGYVNGTARVENVMSYCIAYHFVRRSRDNSVEISDIDLEQDFIKYITSKIQFRIRFGMFRSIMKDRYPTLFTQYENDIELLREIHDKRNDLAHATVFAPPDIINKADKSRILYHNPSVSPNPCEVVLTSFQKDMIDLDRLFYKFIEIESVIKGRR